MRCVQLIRCAANDDVANGACSDDYQDFVSIRFEQY